VLTDNCGYVKEMGEAAGGAFSCSHIPTLDTLYLVGEWYQQRVLEEDFFGRFSEK